MESVERALPGPEGAQAQGPETCRGVSSSLAWLKLVAAEGGGGAVERPARPTWCRAPGPALTPCPA